MNRTSPRFNLAQWTDGGRGRVPFVWDAARQRVYVWHNKQWSVWTVERAQAQLRTVQRDVRVFRPVWVAWLAFYDARIVKRETAQVPASSRESADEARERIADGFGIYDNMTA